MSYPPDEHLLRDLPFEIEEIGPSASRAHLRVIPELRLVGDDPIDIGPLLVVTDVIAGFLVGRVVAPDWMATAQLSLHLADGQTESRMDDEVVIDVAVRREGRTTIVVDGSIRSGTGDELGDALATFVRLPRRDGNLSLDDTPMIIGRRSSMALPGPGFTRPYRDEIGVEVLDASTGLARLVVSDYVRNSFGAVNGGVVTSLAAEAAAALAGDLLGAPARALDLTATYVAQGKVGPLVTRSRVLRNDGQVALVRVEVADSGVSDDGSVDHADAGRALVVAHVHCGLV